METMPSSFAGHLKGTFGWAILLLIIMSSACAHKPNLVPEGYYEIITHQIEGPIASRYVTSQAARLDYPITVAVLPGDNKISINWTTDGESTANPRWKFWTDEPNEPFWGEPIWEKVTWWRFALMPDKVGPALCHTEGWRKPPSGNEAKFSCEFHEKDHIA